ncbi:hypothetical protein [Arthrobacter sp. Cr_A7]|uniref:hypothetical protein n=1 Tax=Arthrobacter sp. Cr_A7 TaxID=3031017 RepID=UPI0023DA72AB|nr:hypothetical protein [Arthrobacter sp. Cr_A7]MDF2052386.1 hypothetical protein [Arthrobacter sp. Cr_A7]
MNNNMSGNEGTHGQHLHAHTSPTTQQMRTVGQRRRDAEEKLEHHLQEARHKDDAPKPDDGGTSSGAKADNPDKEEQGTDSRT